MKNAIIFGAAGMDGSYLTDYLLSLGYGVLAVINHVSKGDNLAHLTRGKNFVLKRADITKREEVHSLMRNFEDVDEVYNLAAQSKVSKSFSDIEGTWNVNVNGCKNILDAMVKYHPNKRFFQASSCEIFGNSYEQDVDGEKYTTPYTLMKPTNPYGMSKAAAHTLVQNYRDFKGLHASNGILYNHEGPRREKDFLSKKVTSWLKDFRYWCDINYFTFADLGFSEDYIHGPNCRRFSKLELGDLSTMKDWGAAKDYVKVMHLINNKAKAKDYIVASNEVRSVEDFVACAFKYVGLSDYRLYVKTNEKHIRKEEKVFIKPISINWPKEFSFEEIIKDMIDNE
jgi:GDPmannose 4,6-dehydratase